MAEKVSRSGCPGLWVEIVLLFFVILFRAADRGLPPPVTAEDVEFSLLLVGVLQIPAAAFTAGALRCHWYLRRLSLPSPEETFAEHGLPKVVYLRSFADENIRLDHRGGQPFAFQGERGRLEIALAAGLWSIGPVVALGEPGESLPRAGSIREYVEGPNWRRKVIERVGDAQLVVLWSRLVKRC